MGKKGTKRRTRWKALPLSGEDPGSGSEDEGSTTSSGRGPALVLRMRDPPYRGARRMSDRDRSREPLVKLESKTFDEEEYTKITTPRQDVLFKKGYFGRRKLESSIEEGVLAAQEGEGEEGPMEQMIITNGFVDERGHYLVNGTSYEIYDPNTNTVTVVVGPPPYTNGVTPPVLAAVSYQPVPLQPVDWYPPGPGQGDWPPGPAWAPAYPPAGDGPAGDSPGAPSATGDPESTPMFSPPFLFPNLVYPVPFGLSGVGEPPAEVGEEESDPEQPKSPTSPPTTPLPQEGSGDAESVPTSPLKPPKEEFVPSTVLKPPTTEFVPGSVLKPPTTEFIPQALKPNGVVFVPQHMKPASQPPPTIPQPEPQESSISKQSSESQPQQNAPRPAVVLTTSATQPPTAPVSEVQSSDKSPGVQTNPPQPHQKRESPDAQISNAVRLAPEAGPTTVEAVPKPSPTGQELPKATQVPANVEETEKPGATPPAAQSTPSTRESHGTQTPPRRPPPNPPSPRRSYAKTVSTGLDQRPPTEPLTNGRTMNAKETIKDNKETDYKRILQNGTILTNGHDVPERINGREATKNARNGRDVKRVTANGDRETNGFIETNDHGKNNWHNGTNNPSGKDRIMGGRDKAIRKEGKDVFARREREVNGCDQYSGKGKDTQQNGLHNGKDRMVNGKDRSGTRAKVETTKRSAQIQLQVPPEEVENKSVTSSDHADDSDTNPEQFRPVENRRNRAQHNGFARKFSPHMRAESTDKEVVAEPTQPKDTIAEAKPPMPRRDSGHKESDKSSTISELSSPTELSSGQTTPQDNKAGLQREETHATELNKSVEKLRDNLEERKPRKQNKKGRKSGAGRHVEVKEVKEEEVFEEPPPLPEFLQLPTDDLMNLDLGDALDHALLRSLRQSEPAITKVNLFPPRAPNFPCDLYTRTNLSQMRATRPEEFFASIVETPAVSAELARPTERPRKPEKPVKTTVDVRPAVRKSMSTAYKPSRKPLKEEEEAPKEEKPEPRLGIVDAVKTWLESQEGALTAEEASTPEPKNGKSNPLRAPSVEGDDGGCGRVAQVSPSPDLATLTDARASVDKYYSLSVRKPSDASDVSEQEAVDALEYAFPRPPALAAHTANFPTKDLTCKLQ